MFPIPRKIQSEYSDEVLPLTTQNLSLLAKSPYFAGAPHFAIDFTGGSGSSYPVELMTGATPVGGIPGTWVTDTFAPYGGTCYQFNNASNQYLDYGTATPLHSGWNQTGFIGYFEFAMTSTADDQWLFCMRNAAVTTGWLTNFNVQYSAGTYTTYWFAFTKGDNTAFRLSGQPTPPAANALVRALVFYMPRNTANWVSQLYYDTKQGSAARQYYYNGLTNGAVTAPYWPASCTSRLLFGAKELTSTTQGSYAGFKIRNFIIWKVGRDKMPLSRIPKDSGLIYSEIRRLSAPPPRYFLSKILGNPPVDEFQQDLVVHYGKTDIVYWRPGEPYVVGSVVYVNTTQGYRALRCVTAGIAGSRTPIPLLGMTGSRVWDGGCMWRDASGEDWNTPFLTIQAASLAAGKNAIIWFYWTNGTYADTVSRYGSKSSSWNRLIIRRAKYLSMPLEASDDLAQVYLTVSGTFNASIGCNVYTTTVSGPVVLANQAGGTISGSIISAFDCKLNSDGARKQYGGTNAQVSKVSKVYGSQVRSYGVLVPLTTSADFQDPIASYNEYNNEAAKLMQPNSKARIIYAGLRINASNANLLTTIVDPAKGAYGEFHSVRALGAGYQRSAIVGFLTSYTYTASNYFKVGGQRVGFKADRSPNSNWIDAGGSYATGTFPRNSPDGLMSEVQLKIWCATAGNKKITVSVNGGTVTRSNGVFWMDVHYPSGASGWGYYTNQAVYGANWTTWTFNGLTDWRDLGGAPYTSQCFDIVGYVTVGRPGWLLIDVHLSWDTSIAPIARLEDV